eukprot:gb/GECH01008706.1/.p1 GENE.gb/GECH01008706.1/~~gb/GECH01008706.1/.p1  ORF type:complete len:187 (+),score=35.51 gb/GECH01008706.1/:1-561(+)
MMIVWEHHQYLHHHHILLHHHHHHHHSPGAERLPWNNGGMPIHDARMLSHPRPVGNLLAQGQEHVGCIHQLAVDDASPRFVTAGDQTVRLWTVENIERDFSLTSIYTYNVADTFGRVLATDLGRLRYQPVFAATTTAGWMHIVAPEVERTLHTVRITDTGAQFIDATPSQSDTSPTSSSSSSSSSS